MKKSLLTILFSISVILSFGQCDPVNLTASNPTNNGALLSFTVPSANWYQVKWRILGSTTSWAGTDPNVTIISTAVGVDSLLLDTLSSNSTYEWRIKPYGCTPNSWWDGPNFTTTSSCNLTSSISITDASCSNLMNGSVDLTINNGSGPYTFAWDNGATTEDLSGVSNNTYVVQVTDNNGCTLSDTAVVGVVGGTSISQSLTGFSPNPLTSYQSWSYDTLNITNTGCDVRIRPDFIITCDAGPIQQGDFVLRYNLFGNWPVIPYSIDANGNAYGFWNLTSNDSTGTNITYGQIQDIMIRVNFVNPANFGTYTSTWTTHEVDNSGNILSVLGTPITSSLSLVDCSTLSIDGFNTTNPTCDGDADGSINLINVSGGSGNFSFSWSNGASLPNLNNITAGTYTLTVSDLNSGCSISDSVTLSDPGPIGGSLTGTNISCFGLTDGSLTAIANGGSGQYRYNWTPNISQNSSISNVSAGTYNLTIVDQGCNTNISGLSFTITEPPLLTYSSTNTNNTSCDNTICNGSFGMTLYGGTTPYTYTWSNGDSINFQNNLCSGSYSISSTDANSCNTFTENVIVYDSSFTPSALITSSDISCFGLTDGTAEAIISSGANSSGGNISTLTYCVSTPGTTDYSTIDLVKLVGDNDSISNNTTGQCDTYEDYTSQYTTLTPGNTYTVDVNLGSCTSGQFATDSAKVFIDWNIDGDFNDIGETVGVMGGIQSPTYNTITFTVPSNGFFGATRMRIVSQYQGWGSGPVSACDVGTFGPTYDAPWYGSTEDYSVVINGTVPATYLWNTGANTSSISNLSAGIYYCEVTDTNNCVATDTISITEPSLISSIENTTNVSCNGGNDGSVSLNINGGTPGYIQDWGVNNSSSLSIGIYNYTITDTNGCTFSDSVNITQPNQLSISSTITDVLCNGNSTGEIDITISGGVSSYNYSWSDGSTSEDLTNVLAGTYYLQVTDANSCVLQDTLTIFQPSSIISSSTTTDASCNGYSDGTAILSISGGTPNYSENWGVNNPLSLSAGIYNYTITDSNNCTHTNSITISEPNSISTTPTTTNVSCNGLSDGTATLSISGGTSGYTEDWGSNNPAALSAGTFNYTISDTNNCTYSDSLSITEPLLLTATYSQTNVSCNGFSDGAAFVTILGGTINYILSWDTLNYPLIGGINLFNTPVGVPAGIYPFGITDSNGCYFTDTITITEPSSIVVSESTTNVSCNGFSDGTATLSISGGTSGYTEDWGTNNPAVLSSGTFNYTITDTNNCTYSDSLSITEPALLNSIINPTDLTSCLISNGSIDLITNGGTAPYNYIWNTNDTTEDLTNLAAGNYSVTITDDNGCTSTNNTTVNQPSNGLAISLISPTYNGFEVSCYAGTNGSITTSAAGGLGNLTFVWDNGDTTQNLSNLSAGSYSVTMTDSVGCSLFDNITLSEPSEIGSAYSSTNVLCNGDSTGSATVMFNGGVTDYLLSWTGYNYPLPNGLNTFITPVGVPAGIYPYSVTDINGCMHFDTITITQPEAISSSYFVTNYNGFNISCNGGNDASIEFQWNGGNSPYAHWFNGISTLDTIQNNLTSGTFTDSLIDANGCIYSQNIVLNEPSSLSLNLNGTNLSCFNSCDGIITSQVTGGVSSYSYSWSNGLSSDSIPSLCIGNYNVDVTDANGCVVSDSSTLTQPSDINIIIDSIIEVSVYDGNDGGIYISANGGTTNYSYSWTGGNNYTSTSEDINGLYSGNYIIEVTDSTNCSNLDTIFINQPPSLSVVLDSTINLLCFGECNGSLYISADGGDSVYTYFWSGPNGFTSTNEDIDSLCAGTYELIVSDTTSSVYATFTVNQPTQLQIITNADTALCYGGTAQSTAYSYGGQYPYTTTWDVGSSSITTYLNAGMHYVNVIDANGCSAIDSILIMQNDSMNITSTANNISCYGLSDGSVQMDVISGGLFPFTYSDNNGQSFQNGNIFNNVSIGISSYIIMDANGCTSSISAVITEPNELIVSLNSTSASCNGECDGTATSIISGGTGSYSEDWGNLDPNNLCAGLVNIIVEDDNNCLATSSVIITEPNPVIVMITANGISLEATAGFLSYQWLDENGSNILGATSENYTPTSGGEYSVEVTNLDGCIGMSTSINFIIESVNNENGELLIYPNPTNGWITVETKNRVNSEIKIINIFGEVVSIVNADRLFDQQEKINLEEFSKGIYIIQLINNNTIINHRIILQ